jgi:hypothetical protein
MDDRNRPQNEGNDMDRDQERGNMGEQKKPAQGSQQGQQGQNREEQQGNQGNQQDRDRKQA